MHGTRGGSRRLDFVPCGSSNLLYAAWFSFSPAVANGTLEHYTTCDWIDNALVMHMEKSREAIYGQQHLPCRVAVNAKVGAGVER